MVDEVAMAWATQNTFTVLGRDRSGGYLLHARSPRHRGFFEISYRFSKSESSLGFYFISDSGEELSATQFSDYKIDQAIRQLEGAMKCPG